MEPISNPVPLFVGTEPIEQPVLSAQLIYFPQFVDGGGYTTSLILLNPSEVTRTGSFQILDDLGRPMSVRQAGGPVGASFNYSIAPNGAFRFQTDGSPADYQIGWVRLTPDAGNSAPKGSGVFGFNPEDMLVTESGIPSATATTHARIYVDISGNHQLNWSGILRVVE